jgi:hypothetical protein
MTHAQQRDIARKLRVLEHADQSGKVSQTCRYFGISRTIFCPRPVSWFVTSMRFQ